MNVARQLSIWIAWLAFAVAPVSAQAPDLSRYRQFHLGMTLAAVTQEVGPTPEVRMIHQRPALIQELTWYPPRSLGMLPDDEAVREVLFTFYNGELCRLVIEYDGRHTEGLTVDDMVGALALRYGPASLPRVPIMGSWSNGSHLSDEILANWEDPRFALTLFRPTYLSSFGLVVTERRLDGLARRATDEAIRLDAQEAPQRDSDQQQAQNEATRVTLAKARQTNKGTFRP
jgi:hypothetical protein